METITNLASTAASTASKLIYGEQPKAENNETAGKEPLSGEQGKGTPTEPFDQGNAATPLDTTANKSTFLDYSNNGTSDVSGDQGKSPLADSLDQSKGTNVTNTSSSGNDDFLQLNPTLKGPSTDAKTESSGDPKIYTNRDDTTYTGMPIVPLNPDVASSGPGTTNSVATETAGTTEKTGITDKVWKDTPIDDISRSGAPGAGPAGPDHVTPAVPESTTPGIGSTTTTTTSTDPVIKTAAPDSVTAASETYGSSTPSKSTDTQGVAATKDSKTTTANTATDSTPNRDDTPAWTSTGVPAVVDPPKPGETTASKGTADDKHGRKSESGKSPALATSTSNDEKSGKMSHLKEKLKDKLHIGSKDK